MRQEARSGARGMGPVLAVAALTLLPIVAALVLYLHPEWAPEGRVHHGELVEPAKPFADPLFTTLDGGSFSVRVWRGRWTLLLAMADCAATCRADIDTLTRIRLLLGADQERVQEAVALLATEGAPALRRVSASFPRTLALKAGAAPGAAGSGPGPLAAGAGLYVLDPALRVVLRYPPGFDALGALADLKRLMRYSWVG